MKDVLLKALLVAVFTITALYWLFVCGLAVYSIAQTLIAAWANDWPQGAFWLLVLILLELVHRTGAKTS